MSDTTYVDYVAPAVSAEWLNEINDHVWHDTPVVGTTVHDASNIKYTPYGVGGITTDVETATQLNKISVENYGAIGDGVTDDTTSIIAAISAATTLGVSEVHFLNKEYCISSVINLGNGSASTFSTVNSISLIGAGAPFLRLKDSSSPARAVGTRLKWIGTASTNMVKILGPCQGVGLRGIALNGMNLVDVGLDLISASRGQFLDVTISNCAVKCLHLNCVSAESIGGATEGIGSEGNEFNNLRIDGVDGVAGVTCIDLDGYTGSASNGHDTTRNVFSNTYLLVNKVGGTGVRMGFTDQNTFHDIVMTGAGVSNGSEASLLFAGTATVPNGYKFPQNMRFTGNVDLGQYLPIKVTGTPGGGNTIDGATLFDNQVVPDSTVEPYVTFEAVESYAPFPKGGFWAESGLTRLIDPWKNKFRNIQFRNTIRAGGTGFTTQGDKIDDWGLSFNGTVNFDMQAVDFVVGQTEVPFEPKRYLMVKINSASGGTYCYLNQKIPGVATLEGRKGTLSAWVKADSARTITGRIDQKYGTGGSPSGGTGASVGNIAVTTSWKRMQIPFTIPSITGKTLGTTVGTDSLMVSFALPINTALEFYIALPQFEAGIMATTPEIVSPAIDEANSRKFLQKIGLGLTGLYYNATNAVVGARFDSEMIRTPTLTADGSTVTIYTPGTATRTATATIAATALGSRGAVIDIGAFSGAAAGQAAHVGTDFIIVSAELP